MSSFTTSNFQLTDLVDMVMQTIQLRMRTKTFVFNCGSSLATWQYMRATIKTRLGLWWIPGHRVWNKFCVSHYIKQLKQDAGRSMLEVYKSSPWGSGTGISMNVVSRMLVMTAIFLLHQFHRDNRMRETHEAAYYYCHCCDSSLRSCLSSGSSSSNNLYRDRQFATDSMNSTTALANVVWRSQ